MPQERSTRGSERRAPGTKAPGLAVWLVTVLVGVLLLPARSAQAATQPAANRWLLVVETSRPMQRRTDGVVKVVRDLLESGLGGQLHNDDTVGLWTFNDTLHTGQFPLQTWSRESQAQIVSRVAAFLGKQKFEKTANFDKVRPTLETLSPRRREPTYGARRSGHSAAAGRPAEIAPCGCRRALPYCKLTSGLPAAFLHAGAADPGPRWPM